ncbi:MAG: hypothetical protein ACK55Z_36645, partial [bacterium]
MRFSFTYHFLIGAETMRDLAAAIDQQQRLRAGHYKISAQQQVLTVVRDLFLFFNSITLKFNITGGHARLSMRFSFTYHFLI